MVNGNNKRIAEKMAEELGADIKDYDVVAVGTSYNKGKLEETQ